MVCQGHEAYIDSVLEEGLCSLDSLGAVVVVRMVDHTELMVSELLDVASEVYEDGELTELLPSSKVHARIECLRIC